MARAAGVYRIQECLEQGPRPSESTALTTGDNTITKPAGADGAVVFRDASDTTTMKLKGVGADTGITLVGLCPIVVTCSGASFVLNVSANTTCAVRWFRDAR